MRAPLPIVVCSIVVFAIDAHAEEKAPTAPSFDTSSAVALLGKSIVVTLKDGGVSAGTLAEAGPTKIVLIVANTQQLTIASADIASIRLDTPSTPSLVASPLATSPTVGAAKQSGPPASITDVLINRIVVVRTRDHRVDGMLTSAGAEGVVLKTAHGDEAVDRGAITSIERSDGGGPSWEADDDDTRATHGADDHDDAERGNINRFDHEKRAASHDRDDRIADLQKQARDHESAAWSWYIGAGTGCLTSVALIGIWALVFASPGCLLGAGVGVVIAATCGIVGLIETGAAEKAKSDAQGMAY